MVKLNHVFQISHETLMYQVDSAELYSYEERAQPSHQGEVNAGGGEGEVPRGGVRLQKKTRVYCANNQYWCEEL